MSETKFTPGPWAAGKYKMKPTVFWERGNGTVAIASVHDIASMGDPDANARLIAAAPALYEACDAIIRWEKAEKTALPYDNDNGAAFRERVQLCDDAITKARAALALVETIQ